jgi:hypothetical protein
LLLLAAKFRVNFGTPLIENRQFRGHFLAAIQSYKNSNFGEDKNIVTDDNVKNFIGLTSRRKSGNAQALQRKVIAYVVPDLS